MPHQRTLFAVFALGVLRMVTAQEGGTPAQRFADFKKRFAELQASVVQEVRTQLRSDDLAPVAWGARAAGEFRLADCHPDLRAKLRDLAKLEPEDRRFAVLAILDALIQTETFVPGDELQPFLERQCLEPALVLLGRHSVTNRKVLLEAYHRGAGSSHGAWLACGNLLAGIKDSEFVLELLRAPVALEIAVSETGMARGGARFEFRNLTSLLTVPDGYPPTVFYSFGRARSFRTVSVDEALVAPGLVPIFVQRVENRARSITDCISVPRSIDRGSSEYREARTGWLESMLGPDAGPVSCELKHELGLEWSDADAFLAAAQQGRTRIENEWRALVARCTKAELISSQAAANLTPPLKVHVIDLRVDKNVPLPEVK